MYANSSSSLHARYGGSDRAAGGVAVSAPTISTAHHDLGCPYAMDTPVWRAEANIGSE